MNKNFKKIFSLVTAVVMASSMISSVSAYSGSENAKRKDRTCTTTYGTSSGTHSYTNYYQTAVNVDKNYYKMDGYVNLYKTSSSSKTVFSTGKLRTYYSGIFTADATLYKNHVNGSGETVAPWTAKTAAISFESVTYPNGNPYTIKNPVRKTNISNYYLDWNVNKSSSTAKVRVYCCLEAENSDLGVDLVSRPTRVL